MLSDIRRGLRSLVATPSFVVLAVSCLGLGIGASVMTFTAVNHAFLRPLGSVDAEGLVAIAEVHRTGPNQWWPASYANLRDWQAAVGEQARLAGVRASSFVVGGDSGARVEGSYATVDLFPVLGVAPVLGRGLQPQDALPGSTPVVAISESYWRRQLNGDRSVIGHTLTLDGAPHTVVGVVPSLLAMGMPGPIASARLWLPLRTDAGAAARGNRSLDVVARLAPGVGIATFTAQLETVASELAAVYPENDGWGVGVEQLPFNAAGQTGPMLLFSLGAAALVLLVACVNVANLTLARAGRRRHEFAVRAALGASPTRLVAQLMSEGLAVAALGAVAGLFLARYGLEFLVRFYETNTLSPTELPIDGVSFAFTIVLTFVTTALVSLLPALEVARHGARAQIAESGSGMTAPGQNRLRSALVVGQVVASFVLLVGTVLLSRSFMNLLALDRGIGAERVTSVRIDALQESRSRDDVARYVARVLDVLQSVPGIESAASSGFFLPMRGGGLRSSAGLPGGDAGTGPQTAFTGITPNFFDALEIPLLRGRTFGDNEPGVAVVNRRLADLLWPDQDALGQQFRLDADPERGWLTVVGVSGDVMTYDSSGPTPLPMAYVDVRSFDAVPMFFFVRAGNGAQAIGSAVITNAIESLGIPLRRVVVTPMAQVARDPFWRQQLFTTWFSAFGAAALVLAAIGIYGVLAFVVGQRRREIGIRMAVGARRGQVVALVLRQGALFAGLGIAIGCVAAYALARALQSVLFGVGALEWSVFALVAAALAAVAIGASLAPALRAARVDPNALFKS